MGWISHFFHARTSINHLLISVRNFSILNNDNNSLFVKRPPKFHLIGLIINVKHMAYPFENNFAIFIKIVCSHYMSRSIEIIREII